LRHKKCENREIATTFEKKRKRYLEHNLVKASNSMYPIIYLENVIHRHIQERLEVNSSPQNFLLIFPFLIIKDTNFTFDSEFFEFFCCQNVLLHKYHIFNNI